MSDDLNNDNPDDLELENGHYSEHSDSDVSVSELETEVDDESAVAEGAFDKNLPTTHKYLGRLDNVGSYTLYDDGEIINSMVAIHTNTLVFPGFTLPLVLNVNYESASIVEKLRNGYTFALISIDKKRGVPFEYGVIMEIFETSYKRGTIHLKATGRQRCRIMMGQDLRSSFGRIFKISVEVLGEPKISTPIKDTQLCALKQKRSMSVDDYDVMIKNYKHRKYHLAQYPLPSWIYDHNELCFYVKHIQDGLAQYYDRIKIPNDPVLLSYWFVQNFQLAHEERLQILSCNNVLERLRIELVYLKLERLLCCMYCKIDIANQKHVFAMSKDGVQSNYCNPGGQVYETVTVLEARNYKLVGEPSKQFTWFPGYYWTMMQCHRCMTHLGWLFTSKHLQPSKFYGLANSGIDINIIY